MLDPSAYRRADTKVNLCGTVSALSQLEFSSCPPPPPDQNTQANKAPVIFMKLKEETNITEGFLRPQRTTREVPRSLVNSQLSQWKRPSQWWRGWHPTLAEKPTASFGGCWRGERS